MCKRVLFSLAPILVLLVTGCGGGGGDGDSGGGSPPVACPAPARIQPDSVTQGTLATTDCTVERLLPDAVGDQSLLDQYVVTLPANGELTVSLSSSAFDAFLALFDTNPPVFPPVFQDDDSGGNLDAMFTVELSAGTYVIVANSATSTGVTGAYTLTTSFAPFVWSSTTDIGAPAPRTEHSAVWSGSEVIVWGGNDGNAITRNDGGRYDVDNDSWIATAMVDAPAPRSAHTAVWAGNEMIVWGGFSGAPGFLGLGDGGRYATQTDTWSAVTLVGAPTPRLGHTAVWTGTEMIVWGGYSCTGCANGELGTGARYDPAMDTWTAVNPVGAPEARGNHTAVWTGAEMIVWGGDSEGGNAMLAPLNTGGIYDPATDTWQSISLASAPLPTRCHSAVWADTVMLVFGGQNNVNLACGGSTSNALAAYDPVTDIWTDLVDAPVASSISGPKSVWTGQQLITWFESTGARYTLSSDSWSGIDLARAPESRRNHTLVWTDEKGVVWGGDFAGPLNSGGVYAPDLDATP